VLVAAVAVGALVAPPAAAHGGLLDDLRRLRDRQLTPVDLQVPGDSRATRVTESGLVVGVTRLDGESRAFRWRDGRTEVLPTLGLGVDVVDVNRRGQVLGNANGSDGPHVVLWEPDGTLVDLTGPPWSPNSATRAVGLADDGLVVGMLDEPGGYHPVAWRDGVTIPLVPDRGLGDATAWGGVAAVNARGEVVGTETFPDGTVRGFVWRDGATTYLPAPEGGTFHPTTIDDAGRVYGTVRTRVGGDRPVVWEAGTTRSVPRLIIADVNRHGVAVGWRGELEERRGARVDPRGTLTELRGLGGRSRAQAVNDLGLVVGAAGEPDGGERAVAWVLDAPVPLGENLPGLRPGDVPLRSAAVDVNRAGLAVGEIVVGTGPTPTYDYVTRAVAWQLLPRP